MTSAEFSEAAGQTRLKNQAREAARLVLVEGLGYAEAGRRIGLPRQAVDRAARTVKAAARTSSGFPDDWVVRTVVVPPLLDRKIVRMARQAQKDFIDGRSHAERNPDDYDS